MGFKLFLDLKFSGNVAIIYILPFPKVPWKSFEQCIKKKWFPPNQRINNSKPSLLWRWELTTRVILWDLLRRCRRSNNPRQKVQEREQIFTFHAWTAGQSFLDCQTSIKTLLGHKVGSRQFFRKSGFLLSKSKSKTPIVWLNFPKKSKITTLLVFLYQTC